MSHTLFELEKDYYLGNYDACINKANSMPASRESTFYLCLSYYSLQKYEALEVELNKSQEQCVRLVGVMLAHARSPDDREAIVGRLDSMIADETIDPKDDLTRLVISAIYVADKLYSNALKALHQLETLPALLAQVQICLLINRVDLAEKHLKSMQNKDDFATLTLLAAAQVKLAGGNAKEAQDIAKELEDLYKATPLISNIQTAAAVCMGNYDLAKQHCEQALDLDTENIEALINMLHILSRVKATSEVKARHFNRLKTICPEHELVNEIETLGSKLVI